MDVYNYDKPFTLECGGILPQLTIAYDTYGKLNRDKSNCIWVCHALTANSDVADWWPHTVEKDAFLDPDKYFIVCANIIGSCYGSTGPLSINPETGEPWYDTFPKVTIRDVVEAHRLLAHHLGITKLYSLIGASVGGFQAIEWAVGYPHEVNSLVLIATDAEASPWAVAIDETQRMAIRADKSYGERRPDAAQDGLATARALGLLTYRGPFGYNSTQRNPVDFDTLSATPHRAMTYQRYQGEKLINRFNAYSYMTILDMFDTHDVGRGRGGLEPALTRLNMPVQIVGITTDIIFIPHDMKMLTSRIHGATYTEIASEFGHDGFLVEHELLNNVIKSFFSNIPLK